MTGTAGVMMISRLHCGGGENCETGGDGQKGDELFHVAWGLGLIRCRKGAAYKSDEVQTQLFNSTGFFYEH